HDCRQVRAHAAAALGSAVTAANPPGGKVRSSDAECVELEPASCLKVCWGNAVPKSASTPFTNAMQAIEKTHCQQWTEGQCDTVLKRRDAPCPKVRPHCVEGICKMSEP